VWLLNGTPPTGMRALGGGGAELDDRGGGGLQRGWEAGHTVAKTPVTGTGPGRAISLLGFLQSGPDRPAEIGQPAAHCSQVPRPLDVVHAVAVDPGALTLSNGPATWTQ